MKATIERNYNQLRTVITVNPKSTTLHIETRSSSITAELSLNELSALTSDLIAAYKLASKQ